MVVGGRNTEVAGSFDTGLTINVRPGGGVVSSGGVVPVTPPPVVTCPDITVTFSGITYCIGVCLPRVLPDGSNKFSSIGDMNGVPVTPSNRGDFFGDGGCLFSKNFIAPVSLFDIWGVPDCPGVGQLEGADTTVVVRKIANTTWYVYIFIVGETYFQGSAAVGASPIIINNRYTACGEADNFPVWDDGRATWSCGFGGICTITF
jgi:hypothetical protein